MKKLLYLLLTMSLLVLSLPIYAQPMIFEGVGEATWTLKAKSVDYGLRTTDSVRFVYNLSQKKGILYCYTKKQLHPQKPEFSLLPIV